MTPIKYYIVVPGTLDELKQIARFGSVRVVRNDGKEDIISGKAFGKLFINGEVVCAKLTSKMCSLVNAERIISAAA